VRHPIQIVAVAGRNETLRRKLNHLPLPPHLTLVSQGYVRNMHELLTISDLVLTKPGGLTMSECLAKRKPMLICAPIPGQEERNAAYAFKRGVALQAGESADIPTLVDQFLGDASLRERLQANLAAGARPRAAFHIAETAVQSLAAAA
jgi:processive 1,2-diacylglycerol beta-glucosyltransferase